MLTIYVSLSLSLSLRACACISNRRDERGFLALDDREDEEEEEEEERREWEKCEEVVTEKEDEEEEETEERKNEYSPIDLTQIDDDDDNNIINNNDNNDIDRYIDDTDEDEPQPLAWRLLKKAAEKRYDERGGCAAVEREALREEEAYDDDKEEEQQGEDDVQPTLSRPLSSPPDYSSKTDQELAKELAKYGMKRLGSRTAMIDCLMNIWTEKMVERGDGAAYSQRLEEELLSLSQRDLNVSNNKPTSIAGLATKKRKKNATSILGGARTTREEEEDEEAGDEEEEEEEEEETEAVGIDERALHAKLTAFLKSSRDVYATILRMEPIDIDEVKKLCENGLRMKCISKVKLANYFDSKGVAVRHNAPKKKKKKKTNKQTTPSGRIEKELPSHHGERRAAAVEIFSPIREEDTY
jgi:hypothetical protein